MPRKPDPSVKPDTAPAPARPASKSTPAPQPPVKSLTYYRLADRRVVESSGPKPPGARPATNTEIALAGFAPHLTTRTAHQKQETDQ